ncbi:MAG: SDR family oxidoreductase [Anaerolineae bacterium]
MGKYLVTGGAGFIGSHLVEALVARGDSVRVLDNLATGFRENLAVIADRIEWIEGDVRDEDTVRAALRDVEVVYHEAALPSVPRSVKNPLDSNSANITGTLNVLTVARDNGVRRFIMASSSSVYGKNPALPKQETMPTAPLSPYAVTKVAGEMYARVFSELYGLTTVCLRYFNVFGPRQDPTTQYAGAIAKFMTCALRGEPFPVYGDGEQSRDFTFIENVVRANLLAAAAPIDGHAVMNIACGEQTTLNQIIALLNELTSQRLPTHYSPPRAGDVRHSLAAIDCARTLLGYQPHITLREGLERTLQWYRSRL